MAIGLNTTPDGFCRTLKAQYYKNSCANFMEGNHFGATGGVSKRMRIDIDVKEVTENCYVPEECKDGLQEVVENGNLDDYAIRKLTPMECWRLMGFSDEDFLAAKVGSRTKADKLLTEYKGDNVAMMDAADKIKQVSNSQLYKQAGNSIVVDVLYYIYKELYKAMPYLFEDLKVGSYFSGIGAFEKGLDRLYEDIA